MRRHAPYEEELLIKYLTFLNVRGKDDDFANSEELYQLARYRWPKSPRHKSETLGEDHFCRYREETD